MSEQSENYSEKPYHHDWCRTQGPDEIQAKINYYNQEADRIQEQLNKLHPSETNPPHKTIQTNIAPEMAARIQQLRERAANRAEVLNSEIRRLQLTETTNRQFARDYTADLAERNKRLAYHAQQRKINPQPLMYSRYVVDAAGNH